MVKRKPLLGAVALKRYRTLYIVLGYFSGVSRPDAEAKLVEAGYGRNEVKEYLDDFISKGLVELTDGRLEFTEKGESLHAGGLFKEEVLGGEYRLDRD